MKQKEAWIYLLPGERFRGRVPLGAVGFCVEMKEAGIRLLWDFGSVPRREIAGDTDLLAQVGKRFRTFGGGRGSEANPLAEALKDQAPMFAAGVDVGEVVNFVVAAERARIREKLLTAMDEIREEPEPTNTCIFWINPGKLLEALYRILPEGE